jgi:DNA-binding Lrp family transcriptional regulator
MAKRKVKKKRRKTPDRYKPLVSKLQSKGLLDRYKMRYEPSGVVKMSEVVIDFIEPYVEYAETYEAYQKLVMVAIVAWNTALFPEKKQKAMVKKMMKSPSLPRSDALDMKGIIQELIERKNEHFAEHNRIIVEYHVTEIIDGFHLTLASTLGE